MSDTVRNWFSVSEIATLTLDTPKTIKRLSHTIPGHLKGPGGGSRFLVSDVKLLYWIMVRYVLNSVELRPGETRKQAAARVIRSELFATMAELLLFQEYPQVQRAIFEAFLSGYSVIDLAKRTEQILSERPELKAKRGAMRRYIAARREGWKAALSGEPPRLPSYEEILAEVTTAIQEAEDGSARQKGLWDRLSEQDAIRQMRSIGDD